MASELGTAELELAILGFLDCTKTSNRERERVREISSPKTHTLQPGREELDIGEEKDEP
jgi:hypothetical protein